MSDVFKRVGHAQHELREIKPHQALAAIALEHMLDALTAERFHVVAFHSALLLRHVEEVEGLTRYVDCLVAASGLRLDGPRTVRTFGATEAEVMAL